MAHSVPIWQQDRHLPWQLCSEAANTLTCLCPNTTTTEKNTRSLLHWLSLAGLPVNNVLPAVGVQQTSEEVNLGQAQRWTHGDTLWSKNGGGTVRDEGCGNQVAAIWGPLCKMKRICSGDLFFFFPSFPLLKQTLPKRTPALIVHGKVPWNVGLSLWNVWI